MKLAIDVAERDDRAQTPPIDAPTGWGLETRLHQEHETQMSSGRNYAHAQYVLIALIIAEFPRKLHFQSRLRLAPSSLVHAVDRSCFAIRGWWLWKNFKVWRWDSTGQSKELEIAENVFWILDEMGHIYILFFSDEMRLD